MRQQLKYLLPNISTANLASEALLLAKIDNKNICFLAKPSVDLGELQAASTLESSNMINGAERGILFGALVGLLFGLYTHYFQPWITESMSINWMALVAVIMLLGAALSAIGSAIFSANVFNNDLKQYKQRIDDGAILMIVSAPFNRAKDITDVVSKLHLKF